MDLLSGKLNAAFGIIYIGIKSNFNFKKQFQFQKTVN